MDHCIDDDDDDDGDDDDDDDHYYLVKYRHQLAQPRVLLPHRLLRASPLHDGACRERGDEGESFSGNDIVGL